MSIPVIQASFAKRLDRSEFIATHLRKYLSGKVLDVGCDEAHLRRLVPGIQYTGIDLGGTPDVVLDLEAAERRPIERGSGSFAHYGLPLDRPSDRHKWFFGLTEARDFFYGQEIRFPIRVVECFANEKRRPAWVVALRRMRYPDQLRYLNRYAHTLWAVFERGA